MALSSCSPLGKAPASPSFPQSLHCWEGPGLPSCKTLTPWESQQPGLQSQESAGSHLARKSVGKEEGVYLCLFCSH